MSAATTQLAREYELVYILRPSVNPSDARKVADRITQIVDNRGAKLTRVDNWGKRKLAYPIKKHTRGHFVLVKLVGGNDVVAELERNLRNLDDVMRWQTIRTEVEHDAVGIDHLPQRLRVRLVSGSVESHGSVTGNIDVAHDWNRSPPAGNCASGWNSRRYRIGTPSFRCASAVNSAIDASAKRPIRMISAMPGTSMASSSWW